MALRLLTAGDEVAFLGLCRRSAEFHRPWVVLPETPAHFAAYLGRFDQATAVGMVVCTTDGDMVGMVNVNGIVRGSYQRGVLGFAVFLPYAGKGYMTEGVALAVRHAFERLDLHRLEADIQPGNTASLKLVERLGFRREGFSPGFIKINDSWRDHERWAITREKDPPGPADLGHV